MRTNITRVIYQRSIASCNSAMTYATIARISVFKC